MQALQQQLKQSHEEKTKLYQDNCRLVSLLKSHQEAANFLTKPEAVRVKRLQELTLQVHSLTEERTAHAALHATLSQDHQQLSEHFNHLRELHAKAIKDISDLRSGHIRLQGNSTAHRERPSCESFPTSSEIPVHLVSF
jgi:hypothetical protein